MILQLPALMVIILLGIIPNSPNIYEQSFCGSVTDMIEMLFFYSFFITILLSSLVAYSHFSILPCPFFIHLAISIKY
jgi:hypothetical protein